MLKVCLSWILHRLWVSPRRDNGFWMDEWTRRVTKSTPKGHRISIRPHTYYQTLPSPSNVSLLWCSNRVQFATTCGTSVHRWRMEWFGKSKKFCFSVEALKQNCKQNATIPFRLSTADIVSYPTKNEVFLNVESWGERSLIENVHVIKQFSAILH